jgi:hypothetical protein
MDLAFYNAGCEKPRGFRHITVAMRRLLRRLLRPLFFRLVDILQYLVARLDEQSLAIESLRQEMLRQEKHCEELLNQEAQRRELVSQEILHEATRRQELLMEHKRLLEDQARATEVCREEMDQGIDSFQGQLAQLDRRDDQLTERFRAVEAFGWDHVALARRVAVLEDRIEELLARNEGAAENADADPSSSRVRVA